MLCCRTGFGRIINGWLFEGRENIERYFHFSTHLRPIRQEDNVLWGQISDADKKEKNARYTCWCCSRLMPTHTQHAFTPGMNRKKATQKLTILCGGPLSSFLLPYLCICPWHTSMPGFVLPIFKAVTLRRTA